MKIKDEARINSSELAISKQVYENLLNDFKKLSNLIRDTDPVHFTEFSILHRGLVDQLRSYPDINHAFQLACEFLGVSNTDTGNAATRRALQSMQAQSATRKAGILQQAQVDKAAAFAERALPRTAATVTEKPYSRNSTPKASNPGKATGGRAPANTADFGDWHTKMARYLPDKGDRCLRCSHYGHLARACTASRCVECRSAPHSGFPR